MPRPNKAKACRRANLRRAAESRGLDYRSYSSLAKTTYLDERKVKIGSHLLGGGGDQEDVNKVEVDVKEEVVMDEGEEADVRVNIEYRFVEDYQQHRGLGLEKSKSSLGSGGSGRKRSSNCLLCYEMISNFKRTSSQFKNEFVLKMLSLSEDKVSELLGKFGPSSEWMAFCGNCQLLVNKAVGIEKEIRRLEKRLKDCGEGMIKKVEESCWREEARPGPAESKGPVEETRALVTKKRNSSITSDTSDKKRFKKDNQPPPVNNQAERDLHDKKLADDPSDVLHAEGSEQEEYLDEALPHQSEPLADPLDTNTEKRRPRRVINVMTKSGSGYKGRGMLRDKGKYSCHLCPDLKEMTQDRLAHHIMFHNKRPLKCTKCNLYFSSEAEANSNSHPLIQKEDSLSSTGNRICSTHSLVTTKCEPDHLSIWRCHNYSCKIKFTTETERDLHTSTAHQNLNKTKKKMRQECSWCCKSYQNWAEWQLHRALEHPELTPFCCPHCDQLFKFQTKELIDVCDISKMREHVERDHKCGNPFLTGIPKSPDHCMLCGKMFMSSATLHNHMEIAHGLSKYDSYSCPVCHLRKAMKGDIQGHLKRVHRLYENEEEKISIKKKQEFFCETCGYQCTQIIKFEDHMFTKHGVVPECRSVLECSKKSECTFKCVDRNKMERHEMKEHGADRKHKCQICGKGFLNSNKKRSHEQIHENAAVKPYQCEICGNSFAVKNYLYIHMRLSHQNRPFASTNKKKPTRKMKSVKSKPSEVPPPEAVTQAVCVGIMDAQFRDPRPNASDANSDHIASYSEISSNSNSVISF